MSAFDFRGQGLEALRPTLAQIEAMHGGEETADGLTPQQWRDQLHGKLREGAREQAAFQRASASLEQRVELQAGTIRDLAARLTRAELQLAALHRWCAAADRWREAGAGK